MSCPQDASFRADVGGRVDLGGLSYPDTTTAWTSFTRTVVADVVVRFGNVPVWPAPAHLMDHDTVAVTLKLPSGAVDELRV
jgi:hypothetical protein